jgi:hypothetical protein
MSLGEILGTRKADLDVYGRSIVKNVPSPAYTKAVEAVRTAPKGTIISTAKLPYSPTLQGSLDVPGAIAGLVIGSALAPFNNQAKAEYVVTGATQGIKSVLDTASSGIGGVVGFASLGTEGLKAGVEGGVGAIPQMISDSAQAITDPFAFLGEYGKYIIIGGVALVAILLLSKK